MACVRSERMEFNMTNLGQDASGHAGRSPSDLGRPLGHFAPQFAATLLILLALAVVGYVVFEMFN